MSAVRRRWIFFPKENSSLGRSRAGRGGSREGLWPLNGTLIWGCIPLRWEFPGQVPTPGRVVWAGGKPAQGIPQQLDGRSSVIWGGCRRWGPHPSSSSSFLPTSAHPPAMGGAAPAPFIIICGQVKCAGNSCSGRLSAEMGRDAGLGGRGGLWAALGYHNPPSPCTGTEHWRGGRCWWRWEGLGRCIKGVHCGESTLLGCIGARVH